MYNRFKMNVKNLIMLYFFRYTKNKSFYKNHKRYALEEYVRLLKCPFWTSIERDIVHQSFIENLKILKPFWLVPLSFL